MSGRKSKKNQRLGSSRRGPKGLNRNFEKDGDDDGSQQSEDGRDEFHTTSYYHATQFDHPPSSSIEQQTSALECPPQARGHKDSLMETEMPERKRKMGSTRKSTGRFKGERKLDDERTTVELDEEYVTQPSTSTTEEQHASLTEEEQSSFPSDLSLQTKSSGFGKESGTTPMFAVSENKEKDTIHHQEITSHSHEVVSDVPIDEAMGPSVHSIAVKVAEREDSVMLNEPKTLSHQETQIASTSGQKRRMGSTRRPLGGKNGENVDVQEHSRNMTENESKAEVMCEAKLKMSEEMAQTWDDVARDDPLSHTESALLLSQSLLADRAELKEPDVSTGTETMNQSVGFPLVDSEKPLPETFSHHGTPLLNEALDFEFGSHNEDLDVLNKVLKEAGSHLIDNSQYVSDTRKDTNPSYDFRDVNTEAKKVVLKQKEEPQLEELALHDQESLLSQHDIATLDNNYDCSMVQHIVVGSTSFDMPVSNISHAEPTTTNLPHEMRDAVEERQEIHIEMKQENNFCNVASVTCDTPTDLVSITEDDEDPHILATRENENMSNERGSETEYAFEMTDQSDVSDHNVTQIIMDVRDNEKDGETSTETIWISHQKPCDVSTENKELYKGQEHYSSNISLTHSPTQDDAGKMLENEEVRKDQKEAENTAVNDVTSKSEEMFSLEDSATDRGSHAHQQLFMQSPDKEGYDLHENVTEKSEKEEILFSVESENAAFDRGNERSEGTDGVKEMDAAPVLTLDVGHADLHLEIEARDKTFDSTNSEADGKEENINGASVLVRENIVIGNTVEHNMTTESDFLQSSPDAHMEALKISKNAEKEDSGETNTIPEQSDISIIPADSHREETHSKSSPIVHKRKMGSTRRPLKGKNGQRKEVEHHDENETLDSEGMIGAEKQTFSLENEPSPDESTLQSTKDGVKEQEKEICEKNYVGPVEGSESALLQSSCSSDLVSEEFTAISICHITESQTLTKIDEVPQENTGDAERVAVEEDKDLQLKIGSQNKTFDSTTREAEETEKNIQDVSVMLIREVEVIGDTVGSNMTTESDFHQTSDANMETLNVSENSDSDVSSDPIRNSQSEIQPENKMIELTSEAERTEDTICEASVSVREDEFTVDTVTVDSNMTIESDLLQSDTLNEANLEALKVSKNSESVSAVTDSDLLVQDDVTEGSRKTDTFPEQSDIDVIPEYSHGEEAHSKSSPIVHKRKMGSTRRPLRGNKGQRKELEHHEENETLDSEGMISAEKQTFSLENEPSPDESTLQSTKDGVKEQEMEICEKNDADPVEGSESALLQSSCSSDLVPEESTAIRICHITESQTHTNSNVESQENTGDAERVAAEEDKDLQLEIDSQNNTFDSTTREAEETEKNIKDVSVTLITEVEVIGDTVTVESNMTAESDFLQTSPDAHIEALKVSKNAEKDVSEETNTVPEQSDISIIPADSHSEETHSKSSPVIHKRKMGSTRRPLKGNTGRRKGHDEEEIFNLEDEPSPDESRYTEVSICDISESQTLTKMYAGSQENTGDVDIAPAEGDTESHSENKTFDSTAFEGEATEENICKASVLVREVEFIGDAIIVESNMTTESNVMQNNTSSETKLEALNVSDNPVHEVLGETDEIPKQRDTTIIPEDTQKEEAHSKFTVTQKRKMGSTRRPLRGNKGQRKELEHHEENETLDSEGMIGAEKQTFSLENEPSPDESTLQSTKDGVKKQEKEICEKNDADPVEGSESALLQSSCSSDLVSEESTAVSICHITESQTHTNSNVESQENTGDAERVAVEEDKDLQLEIDSQNKTFDSTTREAEETEKNIQDVSVTLITEVEVIGDTVTVESNMTAESDFLQTSPDAHIEALKVSKNAEKDVSGETNTIPEQSDISIIPADSHREETHSKSSPVIHKRKMGSTRRPLKGNTGRRKGHDEEEIFNLEDEPSPDESRYTEVSICDISEYAGSQENTGDVDIAPVEGDTESHSENKTFDSTAFEGEATEENICKASVLVREVEFIGDAIIVESNMTTESNLMQNNTSSEAKLEALNVSDNPVHEVLGETDEIPKQRDTTIIPEDTQKEEAHSKFTVTQKRKMGSTRRPLRGNKGQRKELEHHEENETLDSDSVINAEKETFSLENEPSPDESTLQSTKDGAKEQEMEICEKNDADPVEGSESALLQSSCSSDLVSEESTAIRICHITESQTHTNSNVESQENTGDAERVAAEEDKDLQLKINSQNKTFDSTTREAEETEKNIQDVSVTLIREVEVIGDTVTVESNMTTESEFLQTSPDAHMEALKVSKNAEKEVSEETNTVPEQSDISIIPADSHREETHSKSSPVIHKRKMGSTRRPLKGNTGRRKGYDEEEIFNLEDEPSPDESRYTEVSICDISESQTITKIHAGSQENTGDVKIVPAEGDTESHSENKTIYSQAFEGEATEENICAASALDRKVEFIGDAVIVESNMTTESDLIQNYTSTDPKPEALISEIAENEISGKTDTISKHSVPNIIPEDLHGDEVHSKWSLNVQKRKMGSTRRPLRGNKEQRKVRVESKENNGDSEGVSEDEDTETHSEIQNRDNVVDHSVTQEIINIRDVEDEERKTTKTVDMSVQELCDDLEQRSDASQTQTDPSQDDTGSHLLEFQERTADFVRDSNSLSDVVVSDALLMGETQIHVSSNDVPPTEVVEMNPVSKKSMQKRKMGSTRKRGKRMVNDEEVEEKEGETENTTIDDETTKSEEKLTLEEAITGSPVHQQLFSSSADKEGHDIQDIVSKSDVQAENSEQNDPNSTINPELPIESECSSNVAAEMVSDLPLGDVDTYLDPKQSVIPKESHREDQPNFNPVVQKRKMGSTRKTHRGNKGQGRIAEFKKMDGDSEGMTQEQDTEPHLETSARKTEFDEEVEQNFPVEFSHPMASSNMFPEPENGVKEVSHIIHDLSEVSKEKGMDNTGIDSNSLSEAINLNEGTKDNFFLTVSHEDAHQIVSELEQTENTRKVIPTQELTATQDDVVHENNSRKIPATQEKRRKMGSTRRNPRGMLGKNMADNEDVLGVAEDRETKKAADDLEEALSISQSKEVSSVSTTDLESEMFIGATDFKVENDHLHSSRPTVPEAPENTLQICDNQLVNDDVTKHPQSETVTTEKRRKMGSTRKNLREGKIQGKRDGYEDIETEDTNLQMTEDSKMSLVRENVGQQTAHGYSNQSEGSLLSEIERALNKTSQSSSSCDWELIVKEPNPGDLANAPDLNMPENSEIKSLQPMPSAHSEPNSPGRRRKMGSTRKNPRQQLKAEREDEDKEDGEIDENSKANKQEKKDLERVEVSVVHNISENRLNKEYLDVSSAHISSDQLEESTNPVSQEKTSPSTKRKFGSRRANKGKQGLGRLADSDFGNELEDGDHKPDSSEVKDKLHSDGLAVSEPCLTLRPENQPASEQRTMEAKNEEAAPKGTDAGLVSLDQIIKHDTTGAKQTVNLKNRNTEVVQFNVVMVGNSCVGKTSFIRRFHEGQFTEDYRSTIGVDTCVQTLALPDRTVKLQIWDTAGQERFHSITTQVFHKADGLLLMYEITCSKSFISVRDWISQARERAPDDVIMMLLGNKNDSVKREVQIQEGADLAREYNIHFMECSAATGTNVSESMRSLAELLVQRKSQKEKHTTLRREPAQKKSGCC